MRERGVRMQHTSQLNFGGNTDFLNMLERERLVSKKISKTDAVTSILDDKIELLPMEPVEGVEHDLRGAIEPALLHVHGHERMEEWCVRRRRSRRVRGKLFGLSESQPPCDVWLHGFSVVKIHLLRQVIAAFQKHYPCLPCVISATTDTGLDEARKCFPDLAVFPFPFDLSWAVRRLTPTQAKYIRIFYGEETLHQLEDLEHRHAQNQLHPHHGHHKASSKTS